MSASITSLASFFFLGALLHHAVAIGHIVGGDHGWNLPPTPTFFSEWARNSTFYINDRLIIKSRGNEVHDVASPKSQADFDGCVLPPFVYDFVGFISLPRVGRFYFISAMGNDCNAGMKFGIDVLPKL
ncbi:cucumber peeling cupredoxin-like [Cucurbita pepo subsp. pepo]|uniref:cucumber peeling cupredoxin-like n=1 Tax=Cucurbita pepo subsp. pepo TaxID=3664 RepID=UPI000C9D8980|nr:cucumber peeling cupredoxin-like [Cucurbita pepo subsp. pepo]